MKIKIGDQGFTLLEIMGVVILFGLIALLSVNPIKDYLKRMEFKNSGQNIKRLIQTAQSRAMANPDTHMGVYFDLAGSPQKAFAFQDKANPKLYQYDGSADPAYLSPETLKRGVTFKKLPGYPQEIVFRGDGSAYKSMKIVLTDGTLEDTLDVLASTGRVRLGL